MSKKHALIVEDEPDLSTVFANLLEIYGFRASTAEDAQAAMEAINKHSFDFCIIDLTLPDLPGIDLYQNMISTHSRYRGNVIFTSGFNVSDELTEIMKKDGVLFLAKPFTMDKLKKLLNRWL